MKGSCFRIGKDRFKGSQIDRKFSLEYLPKSIGGNTPGSLNDSLAIAEGMEKRVTY